MNKKMMLLLACGAALGAAPGFANPYPEVGLHPGYTLMSLRPAGFEPMVSGMDFLPNGDMVVLTWRGESGPSAKNAAGIIVTKEYSGTTRLYRVANTKGSSTGAITYKEIASGFKDAQGLCVVNGDIYVGDIDRVVKMVDKDGDGVFEEKREIGKLPSYMGWFEYSFGPVYKDGKLYMALASNVQGSGWPEKPLGKDRGTLVSLPITGGDYTVEATGLRAPDGIAIGPGGEIFVTDNQGGWRPASAFIHVQKGKFYGYRNKGEAAPSTPVTPPAIWAPYRDANDSPTEPALMQTGPFKGQFIYGDVGRGGIYRAFLEMVGGEYQGSVTSFSGGLECGIHRIRTGANGEIYVGGIGNGGDSNQGWNSKRFGLQKLIPKGGAPAAFEILATRSRANGMELEFTLPVSDAAGVAANYTVQQWKNTPEEAYGAGKGPNESRTIKAAQVSPDRKSVFLEIEGLKTGYVVGITALPAVTAQDGKTLWYAKTWYTLNKISPSQPFEAPVGIKMPPSAADANLLRADRFADKLKVRFPDGERYNVELLDFQGRSVGGVEAAVGGAEIAIRGVRSGLHILRARSAGRTFSRPVLL
ncbi:MAG TPA: hypothetical protein VJ385_05675 [Fibrobacteria bacterium]|nr:hypothetical protein [Fibrobacteria bacterium]